jgi:hypothetical protein
MRNQSSQWFIPLLLAAGAGLALWYYWVQINEPEPLAATESAPAPPIATESPEPLHPIEPVSSDADEAPDLVALPPLGESDEYLKIEIVDIFGSSVEDLLAESGLIERIVATVDNLPRSHVAERIRPVGRLASPFEFDGQDDSGGFRISPENYDRYDPLVAMLASADLDEMTDLYRRYYPLFQKAYVDLGYPDGYFNDRLVEVIDHLLDTPELSGPVNLVRPHVLFEFEDPRLEALSSGQKLLLRMGSEHAATVKQTLRQLRERVTTM